MMKVSPLPANWVDQMCFGEPGLVYKDSVTGVRISSGPGKAWTYNATGTYDYTKPQDGPLEAAVAGLKVFAASKLREAANHLEAAMKLETPPPPRCLEVPEGWERYKDNSLQHLATDTFLVESDEEWLVEAGEENEMGRLPRVESEPPPVEAALAMFREHELNKVRAVQARLLDLRNSGMVSPYRDRDGAYSVLIDSTCRPEDHLMADGRMQMDRCLETLVRYGY